MLMNMGQSCKDYVAKITAKFRSDLAGEHAYRPALEAFFESVTGFDVLNDPRRSEFGAPDFIFHKGQIPVAYAETKDVGESLDRVEKSEQMSRYYGYSSLVLTDYVEFRFYRHGIRYCEPIVIALIEKGKVVPKLENYEILEDTLKDFITAAREPIKSGAMLARIMAGKARRIRENVRIFLTAGNSDQNKDLIEVRDVMRKLLLADLDDAKFADMYAQTIVYGLFVARYGDETSENFSRQEARDLVPASNPFLRHFFDHVAGASFDKRLEIIVNELCEEFAHADVRAVVHDYFKMHKDRSRDPIIHFYEDFLREYDANERIALGVFYTPLPVVRFIIRAVDAILKHDFGFADGLGDREKTEIEFATQTFNKKFKNGMVRAKREVHRLQILDPAVGTGTFLNETILHIRKTFEGQEGRWSDYVQQDLLPRLSGFEIMMAPYTIAHLKLATTLQETGVKFTDAQRIGIYLTNSLESSDRPADNLLDYLVGLGKAVAEESAQAARIKDEMPIMVVLGNPPYNVSSQNRGEWIGELIKDYKEGLRERKISLDDDYIKFIRLAQFLVEKNSQGGVVGFITNNSYLDGVTHRQMRRRLLQAFDEIYVLDLHGSVKKKEKAPDGGKDESVFDIQQGVSIVLFVRKPDTSRKITLGRVFHAEIFGTREMKYSFLDSTLFRDTKWEELKNEEPYFFFVKKDFGARKEYELGFKITEVFSQYNSGIQTKRDDVTVAFTADEMKKVVNDFQNQDENVLRQKYDLPEDGRDWRLPWAIKDIQKGYKIVEFLYRPFDIRWTAYTENSKGFIAYPREKINRHIVGRRNRIFITCRNQNNETIGFVSKYISDLRTYSNPGSIGTDYVFPLYIFSDKGEAGSNLSPDIMKNVEKVVGTEINADTMFDYIYAVLSSPSYCRKYREFLKIDFPRVPYPKDAQSFRKLAELGRRLCDLHLMESPDVGKFGTSFSISGDNVVGKVIYKNGHVFINEKQNFGNVTEAAWSIFIGGYQPAQKWLKARKGRKLSNEDIVLYQKIIVALDKTSEIMKQIDSAMNGSI